jgi:hypothetical protein
MEDKLLNQLRWMNFGLLCLMILSGLLLGSPFFAWSIFAGGVLILANFTVLSRVLTKALNPRTLAKPSAVLVKYYLRFILTGLILLILISQKWADPLGLLLGLSTIVFNLIILGILMASQKGTNRLCVTNKNNML